MIETLQNSKNKTTNFYMPEIDNKISLIIDCQQYNLKVITLMA